MINWQVRANLVIIKWKNFLLICDKEKQQFNVQFLTVYKQVLYSTVVVIWIVQADTRDYKKAQQS